MSGMEIGVIGLGGMGGGMANRLLDTGHDVTVWNRSKAAAEPVVARGAKLAATPGGAVKPGGLVITMVANDAAREEVTAGPGGLLDALGAGKNRESPRAPSPKGRDNERAAQRVGQEFRAALEELAKAWEAKGRPG